MMQDQDQSPKAEEPETTSFAERLAAYQAKHHKKPAAVPYKASGWNIAIELFLGPMVGLAAGYGLDELFQTSPLFLLIFFLLGLAGSVLRVIRIGLKMSEDEQNRKP